MREFRDGAHGFMVWATGVLMDATFLALAGGTTAFTAAHSGTMVAAGAAGGVSSKAADTLARGPADYGVDILLRRAGGPVAKTAPDTARGNDEALRADSNRIFRSAIDNRAITSRDRDYLVQIVASRGLSEQDAQKRVDDAIAETQALEGMAREAADKARKTAVITGFLAAASQLIGLGGACAGASLGGRHRDENRSPMFSGRRFW